MNRVTFLVVFVAMMSIFGCSNPGNDLCDDVTCTEHAYCESGMCVCEDGWSGSDCDVEDRCFTGTLNCGSHGDCVDNACVCDDGWQGELCDEQDPCYGVDCGNHGNCVDGACACDTNYYGETCSVFFDCSDSLACALVCPDDSGQLVVEGPVLTGNYAEYEAGTFSECTYVFIRELIARQVPDPNEGRVLDQAYGMTVKAVSADLPRNEDGTWNDVPPQKEVKLHFANHRARVLRHVPEDGGLGSFDYIDVTIEPTGSSAMVAAFSDFLLLDTDPVIAASVPETSDSREVTFCFTGTLDEGSSSVFFLDFSVEEDGTPLTLTPTQDSHCFTITLSGGSHALLGVVDDPNGSSDSKSLNTYIDLCSNVTCEPWQTCRELDGECVGDDPCVPNPCGTDGTDYGTCDNSTGEAVCDCYTGFAGALCDACDTANGYEGTFPDCELGLCFNVDCPDDNNPCSGTEACDPADGECKHYDPIVCEDELTCRPEDGECVQCLNDEYCNGDFCDPDTGNCVECMNDGHCGLNAVCQASGDCTCADGYQDPNGDGDCLPECPVDYCGDHGNCDYNVNDVYYCNCTDGWSGDQCEVPPAPTISNLQIDCSSTGGWCASGGLDYPVTFSTSNATTCSASAEVIVGSGTSGSASDCTIVGNSGFFTYTTGSNAGNVIRITTEVTGPGGNDSAYIDVTLE